MTRGEVRQLVFNYVDDLIDAAENGLDIGGWIVDATVYRINRRRAWAGLEPLHGRMGCDPYEQEETRE